jgi:hypothetical protein
MTDLKVAVITLATVLLPVAGAAQVGSRLEAGALVTDGNGGLPANVFQLAPDFQYRSRYVNLAAHGAAWLNQQQWQVADAGVSGIFTSPTVYGVRAEFLSNASRAFSDQALGSDEVDVQTRVHVLFHQRGGVWVGGGVARPWRLAVISSIDVAGAGGWAQFGSTKITGTYTNFSFTKTGSDTSAAGDMCAGRSAQAMAAPTTAAMPLALTSASAVPCSLQSRFGDLTGAVHWEHGALEVDAGAGYRFGSAADVADDSRRWSSATATLWLDDRIGIVAGGGREPENPSRDLPARNFGSIGLVLAYWPLPRGAVPVTSARATPVRSFDIRQASSGEGLQKITVHVGGVESVDVMGDFSDWTPLTLVRHGRDTWELNVPMSPGVHQIDIRVDGGTWVAPPGMPTMRDGFNGEVGVLVVNAR